MHTFHNESDLKGGDPQILRAIAHALKNAGIEQLSAVDVERAPMEALFGNNGRLSSLNMRAVGVESASIILPEDMEPLRFILKDATLDPVPKGKVVAICGSLGGTSGQLNALIFSKDENGLLTFESNEFLACA